MLHTDTHTQTDGSVYRVAPQLKITVGYIYPAVAAFLHYFLVRSASFLLRSIFWLRLSSFFGRGDLQKVRKGGIKKIGKVMGGRVLGGNNLF